MQLLTQRELGEWIEHLVAEVVADCAAQGGSRAGRGDSPRPCWIPAAELVRRMSQFVGSN